MTSKGITLRSQSLMSKFGFMDGDIVSEYAGDNDIHDCVDFHPVLVSLVKKHLVPLLPPCELEEIQCCHNPIRTSDTIPDDIEVTVPHDEVIAAIKEAIHAEQNAHVPMKVEVNYGGTHGGTHYCGWSVSVTVNRKLYVSLGGDTRPTKRRLRRIKRDARKWANA